MEGHDRHALPIAELRHRHALCRELVQPSLPCQGLPRVCRSSDKYIRPRPRLPPAAHKPALARRQVHLAGRPRHTLASPAATRAIHPLHRVHEGLERFDAIENTLEVHPAAASAKRLTKQPHLLPKSAARCSYLSWPARRATLSGGLSPPHAGCSRSRGEPPQAGGGWRTARQSHARDAAHPNRQVASRGLCHAFTTSGQCPVTTGRFYSQIRPRRQKH